MNTLILDTADNKKNTVGLKIDNKEYFLTENIPPNKEQVILLMMDKILKKYRIEPEDLSAIEVNIGPGSYTGLRVGLAIANALSFALKMPVNGKKIGEIILPIYR